MGMPLQRFPLGLARGDVPQDDGLITWLPKARVRALWD